MEQKEDFEIQFKNWLVENFPVLWVNFSVEQVRALEHIWFQSKIKLANEESIKNLEELANKNDQIISMLSGKLVHLLEKT